MNQSHAENPPVTYHLVPREFWDARSLALEYLPEAYDGDGFIHCTDGETELVEVANRYYKGDGRDYVVLAIARDRLTAPVKYEDPDHTYPHIYGPLNIDAVVAVRPVRRDPDGTFIAIDD